MATRITVNGQDHDVDAAPDTPLLYVLRNDLGLNGPKFGCGLSQCGACSVLVDGVLLKSCMMLAVQADGASVRTVEGLGSDGELDPLQQAFGEHHALQCGYCTPGMLMSATYLLRHNPEPTEQEIRRALQGNICRCTGYVNIVEAIQAASGAVSQ